MSSMKKRFSREAFPIETGWQPGEPMPSIPIWELRSALDVDDLDRFDATTELYLADKTFTYTNDSGSYSYGYGYLDGYDYVDEGGGIAKTPEELFAAIDNWINQDKDFAEAQQGQTRQSLEDPALHRSASAAERIDK